MAVNGFPKCSETKPSMMYVDMSLNVTFRQTDLTTGSLNKHGAELWDNYILYSCAVPSISLLENMCV